MAIDACLIKLKHCLKGKSDKIRHSIYKGLRKMSVKSQGSRHLKMRHKKMSRGWQRKAPGNCHETRGLQKEVMTRMWRTSCLLESRTTANPAYAL